MKFNPLRPHISCRPICKKMEPLCVTTSPIFKLAKRTTYLKQQNFFQSKEAFTHLEPLTGRPLTISFLTQNVWPGHFIISYTPLIVTSFLVARWLKFSDARQKSDAKKPVVYVAFIFNQKRKDRSISLSFQRRKDDIFKHGVLD